VPVRDGELGLSDRPEKAEVSVSSDWPMDQGSPACIAGLLYDARAGEHKPGVLSLSVPNDQRL